MENTGNTDLRAFLERAAAKKRQHETMSATPSSNESQMQLVIFQEQSGSGTQTIPPEPERAPSTEALITEDDDGSDSSDEDSDDDIYDIEPDPGFAKEGSRYCERTWSS